MKISAEGLKVLRNFSTINPSIVVHKGDTIRTVSQGKTILANYKVAEPFPVEFAIYDLNQFLAVVSLFEDPEFEFSENSVVISDSSSKSTYFFADKGLIGGASTKALELPDHPVSFTLSEPSLKAVMQAANVMRLPEIHVVGDGETISIVAGSVKHSATNNFARPVGTTDKTFRVMFKLENLKMMLGEYDVQISSKGISKWVASGLDLTYYIAVEANSTFGV